MIDLIKKTSPVFSIWFYPQPAPPMDPVKPPAPSELPILDPGLPNPQPSRMPLIDPSDPAPMMDPTPPPSWRPVAWVSGAFA